MAISQGAGPAQPLEPHAESERRRLDRLHVLVRVADAIALAPRLLHAARLLELAALCALLGVELQLVEGLGTVSKSVSSK